MTEEQPHAGPRASASSVAGAFFTAFNELGRAIQPSEKADQHFREARKQVLLAFREMIDHRLHTMSKNETKGTRVVVD